MKKQEIMEMMQTNMQKEKRKFQDEKDLDVKDSNLINTKEIILMDQLEKIRLDQTKLKKIKDDEINRSKEFEHTNFRKTQRSIEKQGADQIPFYERLRHKSNVLEVEARKNELSKKETLQFRAAYIDGKCLINSKKIEDMAKTDEIRALKEAEDRQIKYDILKSRELLKRSRAKSICRQQNKDLVDKKHSVSLARTMKDRQSEFLRTVLNNPENKQEALVFATIKLPEILKGMEEKDFRLIKKQKQVNFKKGLDLTI